MQGQPDHRDLRQGGPRLPEPEEEPAEGGGRAKDDRETAGAGATRRPGRAGPTSRGGVATRSKAAVLLARGVGHGIAVSDGDRIGQRRRDGGGAAAEKG